MRGTPAYMDCFMAVSLLESFGIAKYFPTSKVFALLIAAADGSTFSFASI